MKKVLFCSVLLSITLFSCSLNCDYKAEKEEDANSSVSDDSGEKNSESESDLPIYSSIPSISAEQNQTIIISANGTPVVFNCSPNTSGSIISYQWYSSPSGSTDKVLKIDNATSESYTTGEVTKGVHYYYCTTKRVIQETDDLVYKVETNAFTVAYTGLPAIYIETPDKAEIPPKTEDWLEKASITLKYSENPEWEFENLSTSIRGRGNTSWSQPKKPYALKLDKKREIMGMPVHKRWVLIANYLDNSYIRNSMAFYLSEQFGLDYTVRGKFVDLILNGEYKGLYWFGEAIKANENRVDIDEDDDYLIEMDTYYDEDWKFKSSIRKLPYQIKNDDEMTEEKQDLLEDLIGDLEDLLYPDYEDEMATSANWSDPATNACCAPDEDYQNIIDIDSWIKFWLVNEIMDNNEIKQPKSCYFTYETSTGILKAGPVWDFDWAVRFNSKVNTISKSIYYDALFKSPAFRTRTKEIFS